MLAVGGAVTSAIVGNPLLSSLASGVERRCDHGDHQEERVYESEQIALTPLCSFSRANFQAGGRLKVSDTTIVNTVPKIGDALLDRALLSEMIEVCKFFGINPLIRIAPAGIYKETGFAAFATTNLSGGRGPYKDTKGAIIFTAETINLARREQGGYSVAGTVAHEGAHIFSYYHQNAKEARIFRHLSSIRRKRRHAGSPVFEVFAVGMSAFYMGVKKPCHNCKKLEDLLVRIARGKGDRRPFEERTHPSKNEAEMLVRTGFRLGRERAHLCDASALFTKKAIELYG